MKLTPYLDLAFRTSSYTDRSDCVEVADLPDGSVVRDSKNPHAGHITFGAPEWTAFMEAIKTGQL